MKPIAAWTLNIATVSEANKKEHWKVSGDRHKSQQKFVRLSFIRWTKGEIATPCEIRMTRLSERSLDDDNLRMSLKWIRDQLADCIFPGKKKGQADSDPRIKWDYSQEKHPIQAVRIEIFTQDKA